MMKKISVNNLDKLKSIMETFSIDFKDICLDGSSSLCNNGIRRNRDIDFIATTESRSHMYKQAKKYPECEVMENGKIVFCRSDTSGEADIELTRTGRYEIFGLKEDDIVNDSRYHTVVDGFKFTRLELVMSIKFAERRPKDLVDIEAIEKSGLIDSEFWNWDLVYALPPWERLQSVVHRKEKRTNKSILILSKQAYSLLRTKGLVLFIQRVKVKIFNKISKIFKYIRASVTGDLDNKVKSDVSCVMLRNADILSCQYYNNKFIAWDLVLQYAILIGKIDKDFLEINHIMNSNKEFSDGVSILSRDLKIISGSNFLAGSIVKGKKESFVKISSKKHKVIYDDQFLDRSRLTSNDKKILHDLRWEIFDQNGLFFYGVIWPSAEHLLKEILDYIGRDFAIIKTLKFDIAYDDFHDLIFDIYSIDPTVRKWTIQKKFHECAKWNNKINFVVFEVPNTDFYMSHKGHVVSRVIQELKINCRKRYYKKVNPYIYDNIIHIADNYEQNRHMKKIAESCSRNSR